MGAVHPRRSIRNVPIFGVGDPHIEISLGLLEGYLTLNDCLFVQLDQTVQIEDRLLSMCCRRKGSGRDVDKFVP